MEGLALVGAEIGLDDGLVEAVPQGRGEEQAVLVVEGDKVEVEGGVVEAGQGQAVAEVQALGGMAAPGGAYRRRDWGPYFARKLRRASLGVGGRLRRWPGSEALRPGGFGIPSAPRGQP